MQFSRAVDYGLLGLVHLAADPARSVSVSEIARGQNLALAFLRKIFQRLKSSGLVKGKTGAGYRLARLPKLISIRQVLEAVEGPTALNICLKPGGKCALKKNCRLSKVWEGIQTKFLADLNRIRLTDLI